MTVSPYHQPLLQTEREDEPTKIAQVISQVQTCKVKWIGLLILGVVAFHGVTFLSSAHQVDDQAVNLVEQQGDSTGFLPFLSILSRAGRSINPPPVPTFGATVGCCEVLGFDLNNGSNGGWTASSSSTSVSKSFLQPAKENVPAKGPSPFASIARSGGSIISRAVQSIRPPPALTYGNVVGCCEVSASNAP